MIVLKLIMMLMKIKIKNSHRYCFVCKIEDNKTENSFRTICRDVIVDVYLKAAILIPLNSRCCSYHLTDSKFLKKEEYNKSLLLINWG